MKPLLRLLKQHNVELESLLSEPDTALSLPRIPVEDFDHLIEKVSQHLNFSEIGLLLGQEFRCSDFPLLPFLLNACQTGRDLLILLRRYYSILISDADVPDIFTGPNSTKIVFYISQGNEFGQNNRVLLTLAGLHNAGNTLGDRLYQLLEVGLCQAPPTNAHALQHHLQVPIHYHQTHNWISISSQFLNRSLMQHNPVLMNNIQQWVTKATTDYLHLPEFSQQVTYVLRHWPAAIGISKEATAELLGTSSRTLTRRLQEEGVQFSSLLKDVRLARAQEALLNPKANMQQLALELGFSDRRGFERAFKQWTGATPAAFKRANKHQPSFA